MTTSTEVPKANLPAGRVPRVVEIALILSLALNCFVLGGVVITAWHFQRPPMPPPESDLLALEARTGLSEAQAQQLVSILQSDRATAMATKSQCQPLIDAYLAELAEPSPNPRTLAKLEEQIRSHRVTMHEQIASAMVQWMSGLSVEQRRALLTTLGDDRDPISRGIRWTIGM